jgi:uncharacterized protein
MLTADLVDARKKGAELVLRPLDAAGRAEAVAIAEALLEATRGLVGQRREEVEEAWAAATADAAGKRFKLAAGLRKLTADGAVFEAEMAIDPSELRRVLFTHASELRRTREEGTAFDRAIAIDETARILGVTPDDVERGMFADLRSEHLLRAAPTDDAAHLVAAWELGQAQAVLLTAVKVTCEVRSGSAGLVRAFFARLKFHKLLFQIERIEGGWRVTIDGPYSMFDAVTKYGLRLALVLPALRALESWSLVADIRWGKTREALTFKLTSEDGTPADRSRRPGDDGPHLADDVAEVMEAINARKKKGEGEWRAAPAQTILDVPGFGVIIPDLELTRPGASPVYLEVLGYWSRDAVFRRVELAERGLGARIVFAVSSRLRVSPEVLDETTLASLYVYKGRISARAVLERADRIGSAS